MNALSTLYITRSGFLQWDTFSLMLHELSFRSYSRADEGLMEFCHNHVMNVVLIAHEVQYCIIYTALVGDCGRGIGMS